MNFKLRWKCIVAGAKTGYYAGGQRLSSQHRNRLIREAITLTAQTGAIVILRHGQTPLILPHEFDACELFPESDPGVLTCGTCGLSVVDKVHAAQ